MRRHICHTPAFGSSGYVLCCWRSGGFSLSATKARRRAASVALRGGLSLSATQRRDGGSTPGERAAAASGLAPSACARAWRRSAACAIAPARHTCVNPPSAAQKAQTTCTQICRPFCFRPQFLLSLLEGIQNERARLLTGRCCTLNSHWLYRLLSFVLRQNIIGLGLGVDTLEGATLPTNGSPAQSKQRRLLKQTHGETTL